MANMRRAEKNGFGIVLDFKTLTKERLVSSIKKAFTDKNMHESMAKMHKLFTDYRLDRCCIFFCLHFVFSMANCKSLGPMDFLIWNWGSGWLGKFTAASFRNPLGNFKTSNIDYYLNKQRKEQHFLQQPSGWSISNGTGCISFQLCHREQGDWAFQTAKGALGHAPVCRVWLRRGLILTFHRSDIFCAVLAVPEI